MVISKIKYKFFYFDFLLFQIKKFITSWLKIWNEKHKNIELILRFKYALKIFLFKKFHGCFLTHIKTPRFVVPLIAFRKWKVFAGLKIHPKKILTPTNKAQRACR